VPLPDGILFRPILLAEYSQCNRIEEFHICCQGLVMTKASERTEDVPDRKDAALCVYALWARKFDWAVKMCEWVVKDQGAVMKQISATKFASYSDGAHKETKN
jgi:hypothetical protein